MGLTKTALYGFTPAEEAWSERDAGGSNDVMTEGMLLAISSIGIAAVAGFAQLFSP